MKRIFNFLKKLLYKDKIKNRKTFISGLKKKPKGYSGELADLRKKLSDFLLTGKVNSGLVIQRRQYSLTKNGKNIYRLEGKDNNGKDYSIIISTGNIILSNKDGKLTGFIQTDEAELNRTIQFEHGTLNSFLSKIKGLKLEEKFPDSVDKLAQPFHWKQILKWERFWQEQIILKVGPNLCAVLLVALDNDFEDFFKKVATESQKKIATEELFYLNQGVNSEEMNPNSKNLSLPDFDLAKDRFEEVIIMIQKKREIS